MFFACYNLKENQDQLFNKTNFFICEVCFILFPFWQKHLKHFPLLQDQDHRFRPHYQSYQTAPAGL